MKLKLKLLCCQRRYEECYKLFLENEIILKENIDDYYSVLVFLRTELDLPIDVDESLYSYTIKQIFSYDEERAIEHISKHMNNFDCKDVLCFCSDFPLKDVYHQIRNLLPLETDVDYYSGFFKKVNIFKYEGNGRNFRKSIDYIKVVSIQDTNKIITMYPYPNDAKLSYTNLDVDIKKEDSSKVKRISQIDKFNQRYRKVVD